MASGPRTLATLLRGHRAAAGLSQSALASRSDVAIETVSALERGVRRIPHAATVALLADALGLGQAERDALLAAARGGKPRAAPPPPVPRELPWLSGDFTGRGAERASLRGLLGPGAGDPVFIGAVHGMGGTGKSALAIQVAHEASRDFPDGQLYVDLRGATPRLGPLDPLDALGRMLRSLGGESGAVAMSLGEAAARFRSLAAGRRLLILLDDARDADHVRTLLPGSPSCRVLITSRQAMATLEGARAIHLDVLPEEEALELLGRVAGPARVAAEPKAALDVVRSCGRLPLAIRIAGSRLAARPAWRVEDMARRLIDATRRLRELETDELAVGASFDVSLRDLDQGHR